MIGRIPPAGRHCALTFIVGPLVQIVLLLSCLHPVEVLAHGDAEWIMRSPEYVDQFGNKCCGPEDCERIPESFVREEGLDIHVLPTMQVFRKDRRGAYPSRDASWWWCKRKQQPGQLRPSAACIFFPFRGH